MTPGKCAATDEDTGKACPCRQYREADGAEPPICCQECLHGRSLHADNTPKEESDVTAILRSLTGDKSIKPYSVSIATAREETNNGLRKAQIAATSSKSSSSSGKGKEKSKPTKEKTFRVSAVVVSPNGLHPKDEDDIHYNLQDSYVPSRTELQEREEVGLAVLKPDSGIVFRESWDFLQVENVLRENLPLLFRYLDGLEAVCADKSDATSTIKVGQLLCPWVLCTRSRTTLKGLSRVPDGSLFNFNKGTNKSGWRQCTIFIATRQAIPENIYRKWGKANADVAKLDTSGDNNSVVTLNAGELEVPVVQVSSGSTATGKRHWSDSDWDAAAASDTDSIVSITYVETEKKTPTRSSSRLRSKKFKPNFDIFDLTVDETP
ncbi:hypothetical protein BJ138DRAFT_1120007 [Hygrophoropsis aurantiaca]|uniref:Uncharacterized protein n=1 Tax=Hygrophoropsis aurantiaca TaxID=72124 RepID=A0ACB7ZSR7_9AGAM|nr:hypothetical protein BJ138DRAFT_1120007 [Hygrophoropsis aurantiaca]